LVTFIMDTRIDDQATSDLVHRVRGEFLEMPGLRLNVPQAQRLWGLDAPRCTAVLDTLVERGVLARSERGYSLVGHRP
jgi:hypothetical protein